MSEQRKRMEDVSVLAAYDANHPEERPYGLTLKADHLQAREDRRRLAAALREARLFILQAVVTGEEQVTKAMELEALLAEVDPT